MVVLRIPCESSNAGSLYNLLSYILETDVCGICRDTKSADIGHRRLETEDYLDAGLYIFEIVV